MVLIKRFEFTSRANSWSTTQINKYIPAVKLGTMTGMVRIRFYDIWSDQPGKRSNGMSHTEYRWMFIFVMVTNFNKHREEYIIPLERVCVDELISH